jgi:uncharacterized membrane protein YfcA
MTAWLGLGSAAALIGVTLGLLGGGGSVLTLPLLVYGLGLDTGTAIAVSLFVVGLTSAVASLSHARAGAVHWRLGLTFALPSMVGAYVGGRLAEYVPGPALLIGFALMMVAGVVTMLRARAPDAVPSERRIPTALVLVEGAIVGTVTGLVGAGGGFLVVPALLALGSMPVSHAIGTSLFVIALKSTTGLAGQLAHVDVPWGLASVFAALAIAGSLAGARLAHRLPAATLRRAFAALIGVVAVGMLGAELIQLLG